MVARIRGLLLAAMLCTVVVPVQAAVKVQQVTTEGITAWLVEDHSVPTVDVVLSFKQAGAASDEAATLGLANLGAELITEGTEEKDDQAFHTALESRAIYLGADVSDDQFTVNLTTLAEHEREAFALMAEALLKPRVAEEKVAEVKARTLAALRRLQESPDYLAAQRWRELAYGDHPYGRPARGTPETVSAITPDAIKTFLKGQLAKDQLVMAVVGAMDAKTLKQRMKRYLADLPATQQRAIAMAEVSVAPSGVYDEVVSPVPQTVWRFGSAGVSRHDPAFYAAYVMNYIVGGSSLTSRLGEAVRKERGLTYGISTSLDSARYSHRWGGGFATRQDKAKQAMQTVEETLAHAQQGNITQSERDRAVGYITGSFPLSLDSHAAIASYLIAMQLYDLGIDYLDKRNGYFEQVTVEQVNEQARALLDPRRLVMVRAGAAPIKEEK